MTPERPELPAHLAVSRFDSVVCGAEMLIVAAGDLDMMVRDDLRDHLQAATDLELVLDLRRVTFMDVSIITLLARATSARAAAGRRTVIGDAQPHIHRVFRLARAQHLLAS